MEPNIHSFYLIIQACTATTPWTSDCCQHKVEKCGENEGDCNDDSHCKSGLICGHNNCPTGSGSNFNQFTDCCTKGTTVIRYFYALSPIIATSNVIQCNMVRFLNRFFSQCNPDQ